MSKVYLVSSGQYSSYYIVAVLTNREEAERLQKVVDTANGIEEFELDSSPSFPPGFLFRVTMDIDGDSRVYQTSATDGGHDRLSGWTTYGGTAPRIFNVWADDEQHAVKIINERRLAMIASGEWTIEKEVT